MLREILNEAIAKRQLSVRAAAREAGVSHNTMFRALDGASIDLDSLIAISNWLGMRPAVVLGMETGDATAVLEAVPELKGVLEDAAKLIQSGDASVNLLADIASYIKYKVSEIEKQKTKQ